MRRAIHWFVYNRVAANLLMVVFVIGGLMSLYTVHQEEFPLPDATAVRVDVPYPGASPTDVEQGVCLRVEEAVESIEGLDHIDSTAYEELCVVLVELQEDVDGMKALNDVKNVVDGIVGFPKDVETPIVSMSSNPHLVIEAVVYGDVDERSLKEVARQLREDLAALNGISLVSLSYARPYEISIEISEFMLRRHNLSIESLAQTLRASSLDLPGGTLRTRGGEILVRTREQRYTGSQFDDIVVLTNTDGSEVRLRDIATVVDGFEEGDLIARFNGQRAVMLSVYRIATEDINDIARMVLEHIERAQPRIPDGIGISVWSNSADEMEERFDTLLITAYTGLALVLVVLALFLRFRSAIWVAAGIPIAMLGTIAVFPQFDVTISTMTVIAFIVVLGIVVDDAIVVAERVYSHEQMGKPPKRAAVDGTWEVCVPVIFGVLTTVCAFMPLVLVGGRLSDFFGVIGVVVAIALVMSVLESQLILPAHLSSHASSRSTKDRGWNRIQTGISEGIVKFARVVFLPVLMKAIQWRYVTCAVGLGVLILTGSLIWSGRIVFSFFPSIDGNIIYATVELPAGVHPDRTRATTELLEQSVEVLRQQVDSEKEPGEPSTIISVISSIGTALQRGGLVISGEPQRSNLAEVAIRLRPLHERDYVQTRDILNQWRELVGPIPDAVSLVFSAVAFGAGKPVQVDIKGNNVAELRAAAMELKGELTRFDSAYNIEDTFRTGKQEIQLELLPTARSLGLTATDLALQVRHAFYGAEVQRVQRGADDVRVMVRYPQAERRSIANLEDMRIRTADGSEVPFTSVARYNIARGYSKIDRVDGQRVVRVTADVDRGGMSPEIINQVILFNILPELVKKYSSITASQGGEALERYEAIGGLAKGAVLAVLGIFVLLAIPLRSYYQPLVIMSVIPFGAVGAILGHYIMDVQLMFFSLLGIVALSGVVVNASLVLVDYINRQRRDGIPIMDAIGHAVVIRFRPIVLTSATTFAGLTPLMLSQNPNTFFVVPMAVSLAFGVVVATLITLFLVPAVYVIVEDFVEWDPLMPDEVASSTKSS